MAFMCLTVSAYAAKVPEKAEAVVPNPNPTPTQTVTYQYSAKGSGENNAAAQSASSGAEVPQRLEVQQAMEAQGKGMRYSPVKTKNGFDFQDQRAGAE